MQDSEEITSIDYKRLLVIRSRRRSNIRKKIADYLFEIYPVSSYTSEIADNVRTAPTNLIGAIKGMGTRYKKEESLIAIELVEQVKSGNNIKLYKITDFGKEFMHNLKR